MHYCPHMYLLTESSPWFTQMMQLTRVVKECYNQHLIEKQSTNMKERSAAAAASHGWNVPCKSSVTFPIFYPFVLQTKRNFALKGEFAVYLEICKTQFLSYSSLLIRQMDTLLWEKKKPKPKTMTASFLFISCILCSRSKKFNSSWISLL